MSQMLLFSLTATFNLVLFALMGEGEASLSMQLMHYTSIVCMVTVAVLELFSIAIGTTRRRRESQAAMAESIIKKTTDNILGTIEMKH